MQWHHHIIVYSLLPQASGRLPWRAAALVKRYCHTCHPKRRWQTAIVTHHTQTRKKKANKQHGLRKNYTNTGLLRPLVTQERSHKNTTSHKTSGIRSKTTLIKTNKNIYFITIKTGHWSHSQNTSNNFFPFSGRAILTYRQQDASLKRANNFFVNQQETRKKLLHNTFTKIGTNHTPTRPLVPSSPQPLVT